MSEAAAKPAAPAADSPPKGGGLFSKLTVLVLLLVILGGEALIAFIYLPTAGEVAAAGQMVTEVKSDGHSRHGQEETHGPDHEVDEATLKELDLEKYNLTIPNMKTGTSYRASFHLWGVVATEHEHDFQKLYEHHKHRLRDQIGGIIRRAEPNELAEAGLGLIKRTISTKVNQTLGQPLLHGVVFSEFEFYEQ